MPLKPVRITVNLPAEIADLVKRRVREEKYPSDSAYFVGLALFDLYARRPHLLTGELMREPQWLRDQVIAELVRDFDAEAKRPGGWFEKMIDRLIAERRDALQPASQSPEPLSPRHSASNPQPPATSNGPSPRSPKTSRRKQPKQSGK